MLADEPLGGVGSTGRVEAIAAHLAALLARVDDEVIGQIAVAAGSQAAGVAIAGGQLIECVAGRGRLAAVVAAPARGLDAGSQAATVAQGCGQLPGGAGGRGRLAGLARGPLLG